MTTVAVMREHHQALDVTIPSGWQRIYAERLLDDMLCSDAAWAATGSNVNSENVKTILNEMRTLYRADDILFTAMRRRQSPPAIDILTVALPADDSAGGETRDIPMPDPTPSAELTEYVDFDGVPAVIHRSIGDGSGQGNMLASRVQVVAAIPPSARGAIVTIVSSESCAESALQADAAAVVGSLRIVSVDEDGAPSTRITR